jgi:formamidopyrimidine-DNA glycosylase
MYQSWDSQIDLGDMPELPEVETVRRGLNQITLTQKVVGGDVLLDRTIAPPDFCERFSHQPQRCPNRKMASTR